MRITIGRQFALRDGCFLLAALCVLFLPSSLMVFIGASSFSMGVLTSSVLLMAAYVLLCGKSHKLLGRDDLVAVAATFAVLSFLVAHFLLVNGVIFGERPYSFDRFLSGMAGLPVMIAAAFCSAKYVRQLPDEAIYKGVRFALVIVLINVLFASSKIDFFGTGNIKPSFLFLEPSHIALMASPLILFTAAKATRMQKILLLLAVLAWGLYVQNLTTLMVVVLAMFVCVRLNLTLIAVLGALLLFAAYLLVDLSRFTYFIDRLNITPDSQNLSVLVFMQGWDNARLTLASSHGLGAGYQQLGVFTELGAYSQRVFEIAGAYANRYDGGTTGAKIISEFGYAGIAVLAAHFVFAARCFFRLRRQIRSGEKATIETFAYCAVVCSCLEIYFRGAGYFTPLMFMAVTSAFIIGDSRKRKPLYQLR